MEVVVAPLMTLPPVVVPFWSVTPSFSHANASGCPPDAGAVKVALPPAATVTEPEPAPTAAQGRV